jgi:hypothetical protein
MNLTVRHLHAADLLRHLTVRSTPQFECQEQARPAQAP